MFRLFSDSAAIAPAAAVWQCRVMTWDDWIETQGPGGAARVHRATAVSLRVIALARTEPVATRRMAERLAAVTDGAVSMEELLGFDAPVKRRVRRAQ